MDYKKELLNLLDTMGRDGMAGAIPALIAECLHECESYPRGDGFLGYYVCRAIYDREQY